MLKALGLRTGGSGASAPRDKQEEEAVNSSFAVVDDALSCEYRETEKGEGGGGGSEEGLIVDQRKVDV